ncbi:MAG: RNA polymerase sigma factor [Planctomycetaceae bacterium]
MSGESRTRVDESISAVYARESRLVLATLIRLLGDFDLAEEALQEAFAAATEQWPREGVPKTPRTWLVSAGRFRMIDRLRREAHLRRLYPDVAARFQTIAAGNESRADWEVADDRLRLIFTCCHPAIDPLTQVPLTLREVCGLTTEEIAHAYLTSPAGMAQRIVRGKAKIRGAGIPYVVPSAADLPDRLDAVLRVVYLVFNEGYSASTGAAATRADLSAEAIRLARLLLDLLPGPDVMGLLALMLLHESRREARVSADGDIVLLEDQDRKRWNREMIAEGTELVRRSLASGTVGSYAVQAAISGVHAAAETYQATDWNEIAALYDVLLRIEPTPVVELNRAVAIAMRDGPLAGLAIVERLVGEGPLDRYHLAHAVRGELLARAGRITAARDSLGRALQLAEQEPERRHLQRRLDQLSPPG